LLFSLVVLALVLLPVLTFIRLGRISSELDQLRQRVDQLERASRAKPDNAPMAASIVDVPSAPAVGVGPSPSPWHEPPPVPVAEPLSWAAAEPHSAAAEAEAHAAEPDLEERIGGRGLLYTGVFVLLLGVSFFLKYAFDNAWINETARTAIGFIAGAALVGGGLRLAGTGLPNFGYALTGTGLAVLYLVVYAALNFYLLIGRSSAFALMLLITVLAALLADRRQSQPLALIAVAGGFLTPALVGGDENAQLTLFSYVALLVFGTTVLALRHRWPALNAVSYVGTFITVAAWAARFYSDDQWLRTLLFLTLFCLAFVIILRETRRQTDWRARTVSGMLSTAPVFYHVAAVVITAAHPPAVHIYLIAFTAVGLWLTVEPYRPLWRLAVLLAAFIPMFAAATLPGGSSWLLANVITIIAVALLHVMGLLDRTLRQDEPLTAWDLLTLHLTGLGLFSLLYDALQPAFPGLRGALALGVAAGAALLGRWMRPRDHVAFLHALALAFTLVAIGIAVQFDGAAVVVGWAAEGAAVAWLGVQARNRAFQFGGFVLWVLSTLHLVDNFYETPAAFTVLVNTRTFTTLFVLACGYVLAWRMRRSAAPEAQRMQITLHIVASTLTLAWITAEIRSFWEASADTPTAHLYEQTLLSLAWGVYGALLIVIGMWRQLTVLRYIGITVIVITSLKVFFYDLWELGGIYRVIGFLGFGALLVLVSYLYQNRRRVRAAPDSVQTTSSGVRDQSPTQGAELP
jgi:uncharacterized membrane protein